jgi:hypothetical protein
MLCDRKLYRPIEHNREQLQRPSFPLFRELQFMGFTSQESDLLRGTFAEHRTIENLLAACRPQHGGIGRTWGLILSMPLKLITLHFTSCYVI